MNELVTKYPILIPKHQINAQRDAFYARIQLSNSLSETSFQKALQIKTNILAENVQCEDYSTI